MCELIVLIDGEEFSYGEFYNQKSAERFLDNLYETKEIDSDIEAWVE